MPYVLPFVVFIAFLALQYFAPLPGRVDLVLRTVVLTAVLAVFSRNVLTFRPSKLIASIVVGLLVFLVWIAPDVLFAGYRQHWLFQNSFVGTLDRPFPVDLRSDPWALGLRFFRALILVPIIEELFWRGWLMRSLINPRFESVKPGTFAAGSFWITAILFASEHGPYWDVGLAAGVIYNWWMIRSRNLSDCMVAHAVTNLCLSIYVIGAGHWQYWL